MARTPVAIISALEMTCGPSRGLEVGGVAGTGRGNWACESGDREGADVPLSSEQMRETSDLRSPGRCRGRAEVVDLSAPTPARRPSSPPPTAPGRSAARLQQRRVEAAAVQLGDAQLEVAGLGGGGRARGAVVVGCPSGPRWYGGADALGGLQLDQGLQHQLQPRADKVEVAVGVQRVQQLERASLSRAIGCTLALTCEVNAEVHPVVLRALRLPEIRTTRRDVSQGERGCRCAETPRRDALPCRSTHP